MHKLTAAELLSVWERGRYQPSHRRGMLLLTAAYPNTEPEELAGLSIGRRDSRLLTLREQLFGTRLVSITDCPACIEKLELSFDVSDILHKAGDESNSQLLLEMEGYEIHFRLPDSNDLVALAVIGANRDAGKCLMLKRCLTEVRFNGKEKLSEDLPLEIVDAVTERMSLADPQANVKLNMDCPSCGNNWLAVFDILSFFWSEIETWARRTLREIHILARSYGWRETDILSMSALRRQSYLEMLGV
jgi:hypothetical protein